MIKFPEKKNIYEIKKYFKSYKLSSLFLSKLFTKDTFKPNMFDLYRIHRFIILNKRICALEYGTGWSTIIMSHALKINKLNLNFKNTIRFKNPFSLTVLDDSKKYLNISKKRFEYFFGKKQNIKFYFSETKMVRFNFKYATEYKNHPLINPDFIYLDGPSLNLVKGKINNFTVKHQDMMPMACDILNYEHFLTPGTIIVADGRTANSRFLKNNLQRKWLYRQDTTNDQNIFYLNEKPLGKINSNQLKFYK